MIRSKLEGGDEKRVMVDPGLGVKEATRVRRGRLESKAEMVDRPYDPDDLPVTHEVQEKRRHMRRSRIRYLWLAQARMACIVLGIPVRRWVQDINYLSKRIAVWARELADLEAAVADCRGIAALEAEYVTALRAMRYGVKRGAAPPDRAGGREESAEYMREWRKREARRVARLGREPLPDVSVVSEAEARAWVDQELVVLRAQAASLRVELEAETRAAARSSLRRELTKATGDALALSAGGES